MDELVAGGPVTTVAGGECLAVSVFERANVLLSNGPLHKLQLCLANALQDRGDIHIILSGMKGLRCVAVSQFTRIAGHTVACHADTLLIGIFTKEPQSRSRPKTCRDDEKKRKCDTTNCRGGLQLPPQSSIFQG